MKTNTSPSASNVPHPFIARHQADVIGVLQGWDRLRLQGTLRSLYQPSVMDYYLQQAGVLFKEFKGFVTDLTGRIRESATELAQRSGRPMVYLRSSALRKEDVAREIAQRDGVQEGLIGILSAVEPCRTWFVRGNRQNRKLELALAPGKCIHLYFYWIHRVVGFCHLRLQTWFPFLVQICLNGREWLARQLDAGGIDYQRQDNCLPWIEDLARAQALMEEQHRIDWAGFCQELLAPCHPLQAEISRPLGQGYYWTAAESEYATDVMFRNRAALERIYPALVHHAVMSFGSQEVLRFLGRQNSNLGAGDQMHSDERRGPDGIRVKHWLNGNSLKFYDKGSILRVETTLNEPKDFRVWRAPEHDPDAPKAWRGLRRTVADLHRRAEVSRAATERELEALAAVHVQTPLAVEAAKVCVPIHRRGRRHRALQPFGLDADVLSIVNGGEYVIQGFRNRDIRTKLYGLVAAGPKQRRQAAAITRRLQLLRAHGLIKRVPKSHRYLVTQKGRRILTALLAARQSSTEALTKLAA